MTTVRMETPVIYFYTPSRTTLSVNVQFLRGRLTEWYPAAQESPGGLNWNSVDVLPGETAPFPRGEMENHYYAACSADAAPLQAGSEHEKLLFYRGVGDVEIPLRPKLTAERVQIRLAGHGPVRGVVLFENRGGKVGYRIIGELSAEVQVDRPELTGDVARLRRELAESLIDAGLYPKEAEAMLDTWRDSWFEDGMRVMYIVPRSVVDSELPLRITPTPAETARVFVGRIEMLTRAAEEEIAAAAVRRDPAIYTKYGRFLQPFVSMIRSHNAAVDAAFPAQFSVNPAPCAK